MASVLDSDPLDVQDCLHRLERENLGRVAVSVDAMPAIFPVVYRLAEDAIAFNAAESTRLSTATNGAVVAFEVDGIDENMEEGWSVLVVGTARRGRLATSTTLGSPVCGPGVHDVFIPIERITGRRTRIRRSGVEAGLLRERARAAVERSRLIAAQSGSLVDESIAELDAMRREIATLREALASRSAISSATGILMARGEITSDEAFDLLRRTSQSTNRKLRDIAAELVDRHEAHIRMARRGEPDRPL